MTNLEMGQKIRAKRKQLGLSQRELADLAKVTLRGLTDMERGMANPTYNLLTKITDALGLELLVKERSKRA